MTSPEWCAWVKFGGGQALWDEVSGEFGLKAELFFPLVFELKLPDRGSL